MAYDCPACGDELSIHRSANGAIVTCDACGLEETVSPAGRDDEIYLEICVRHDEGKTGKRKDDWRGRAEGVGEARDHAEIDAMIGDADPPDDVRKALHSRRAYLAQYRLMAQEDPAAGADVGSSGIDERIAGRVRERGIGTFYKYQSDAMELILRGRSVVIEAPTAFGKTEAFLIPIAHLAAAMERGAVRAVFVYPTKALARDQLPKVAAIAVAVGMRAAIFDGDTNDADRKAILADPPEMLITNFDLLHHQMFRHGGLAELLRTARFLVVDEAHEYTGVFGSNVHHIIARLKRLTGPLQCVAASATLNNSGEFCSALFGQEMDAVVGSGRRAAVDFAIMGSVRVPKRRLMVSLAKRMKSSKRKTMIFGNSHRNTELVGAEAKNRIEIDIHRGGMDAGRLRDIEARFRTGELDAISCTSTLELGVDIGDVDCVISEAIPFRRFMQRMGRAGRSGRRGCAFLVLGGDPISQYYMAHPEDYEHDEETPHIDASNVYVEEHQTAATVADRPLTREEEAARQGAIGRCIEDGLLERVGKALRLTATGRRKLEREYSIRGIGGSVTIHMGGRKVGHREMPIALTELHTDAVYMMGGRSHVVKRLGYPRSWRAEIEPLPQGTTSQTRAISEDWPTVRGTIESRRCFGAEIEFCDLVIKKVVTGYAVLDSADAPEGERVSLPRPLSYTFPTKGIRFCAPLPKTAMKSGADSEGIVAGSYHAAEHVIIEGSRMVTGASPTDLGGMSMGSSGMIYVYDGAVGGSGASRALYDRMERAVVRARNIVAGCPCETVSGCPRCTLSYRCGNNNQCLHKAGALESLTRMASGEETTVFDTDASSRPIV